MVFGYCLRCTLLFSSNVLEHSSAFICPVLFQLALNANPGITPNFCYTFILQGLNLKVCLICLVFCFRFCFVLFVLTNVQKQCCQNVYQVSVTV